MKKLVCILLVIFMFATLPAGAETATDEWTRTGFFLDENDNMLSVTYMDVDEMEGWWVSLVLGDEIYGNFTEPESNTLTGNIMPDDEEGEFPVMVSEEGEDGLLLTLADGKVYHFLRWEYEEPDIQIIVDTEGFGSFNYIEGNDAAAISGDPYTYSVFNLYEPAEYTFIAEPYEGCHFVKWTKDGKDFSENAVISVEFAESANYTAVFEWDNAPGVNMTDYLVLVNKLNPLPEYWEDELKIVQMTNSLGDDVAVEAAAYDAYLQLKEALAKDGIFVDLDSAYRSVAAQQEIMDRFTAEYGADYAAKTVAVPGYSEHHTGLALDLYLIIDGKDVYLNEDMVQYPEIWAGIHEKLADFGFILRYLKGREHITGYGYEPWHIRYVGDPFFAHEIMDNDLTLEGFLGVVNETDPNIDLGTSELFTPEEREESAVQIKCKFAAWEGCELHSLRYAGDEASNEENLAWLNSLGKGTYVRCLEFFSDFHSPKEGLFAWNPDFEYKDYQWWLAETKEGAWEVVSWGY